MALLDSPLIEPLHRAEARFLQVLLPRFSLIRRGEGSELRVHFDDDAGAIWHAQAKAHLARHMPMSERQRYQRALDEFVVDGKGKHFEFRQRDPERPDFVFRYASGGTLPIVNFRRKDYFCFFYRDIYPIGWNIANGSCDTRDELLDPFLAVERELHEELLIADFERQIRYIFKADRGKAIDRPEYAVAREFWRRRYPAKDLSTLRTEVVDVQWIDGPDALSVHIGSTQSSERKGCFLNINGDDFGIEIDRIARIKVSDGAIFCDGEIEGTRLVNSPVGFFDVERFRARMKAGPPFLPDFFFFDTLEFDGAKIDSVVNGEFIADLAPARTSEELAAFKKCREKFDLCPVTRRIAARYFQTVASKRPARPKRTPAARTEHEVFISYCREDKRWLDELVKHLKSHRRRFRLWSDRSISAGANIYDEIGQALARARVAVLLVTDNFLASDFIRKTELPKLLQENKRRGLVILWIPVSASAWQQTKLRKVEAMIDPARPLAKMPKEPRSAAWVKICEDIVAAATA